MALRLLLCFLVTRMAMVSSKPEYMQRIPNAALVPDPLNSGKFWNGVGHRVAAGDGARNPFGVAFEAAGERWTEDFCRADTDEDGKTNGEELGDPNCQWTEGGTPARVTGISHPGVCEPVNSDKCKTVNNKWLGQCGGEGADSSKECDGTTSLTAPLTLIIPSLGIIVIKKFFM